jgi:hypothetical protein
MILAAFMADAHSFLCLPFVSVALFSAFFWHFSLGLPVLF